ncbi:hypothetical protein SK069_09450 [Patulibacter brassicae]|jgi:hypothetical protein|uniref:Uncharacterized protein n=1 Tax=Patulibacter brassicae TaxID=1705717 RepID=A0ABU4VKE0_9ACTN|nr:hypothetical protein [Patulibacter brassicae]MDX8151817.1 hypothetical protein [Patulibacter brassicae]
MFLTDLLSTLPIASGVPVERPGDGQIPVAPVLDADRTFAWAMVIGLYAGFAAAVVWAAVAWLRDREGVPAILLVAGVIAANIEPLGDHVGSIVYAPNIPWFDYTVMGRQMPSFILVGLAAYVACGSYYAYRMLAAGAPLRRIALVCVVFVGVPEILMELAWHHWHVIAYYGDNPTRILGIPLYTIVQNSTLLPVYGVATFLALRHLAGAQRLWLLVLVPTVTIGYIVGVSWPVYQAVQSSAPALVTWIAALWTCVGSVWISWAALHLPEVAALREERARREAGAAPAPAPAPAEPAPVA